MATTNPPISAAPKARPWLRPGLWLVALVAAFLTFAQFAVGSQLLWNDSTLLVAAGILAVALFVALSRARAQGIDARRTFLKCVTMLLWFVLISEQVFVHNANSTASASKGNFGVEAFQEVAAWLLAGAVLFLLTLGRPQYLRKMFSGSYKWVSLFALLAVASVPLSPSPSYSLAWAFKLVLTVLLLRACAVSMEGNEDLVSFLYTFLAGIFVIIVLRLILAATAPEPFFIGGRLNELASPTGLSTLAGVLCLLSLTLFAVRRRGWLLFPIAFGMLVILLAGGKTGMVAGVFAAMLFFVLQKQVRYALGLLVIFLVIGGVLLVTTPLGKYFQDYEQSGEASTITGRTDLWAAIWPAILEKPIVGHGYVASRFLSIDLDVAAGWEPPHTHNSFLEPLYNNGIPGLLLVLIMNIIIVSNLLSVVRNPADQETFYLAAGAFSIYVCLFINGMLKVTFGGSPDGAFTMFLALFVVSVALQKTVQRAPAAD
jgi:exopolysaccharide production protein ExoQ